MSTVTELPHPHKLPAVGTNLRNGNVVTRDPLSGEMWTLYDDGTATETIPAVVQFDHDQQDCAV